MITMTERSQLAVLAYNKDLHKGDQVGHWQVLKSHTYDGSGLTITALIDKSSRQIEFIVGGTDQINPKDYDKDIAADKDFMAGGYHDQFRMAVEFTNNIVKQYERFGYSFGTSGHSLGGGIAQVLSYTFGFDGLTLDAPPATRIIQTAEYWAHIESLGITPKGAPVSFVNVTEDGSKISFNGPDYIGLEFEVNQVPNTLTDLGDSLIVTGIFTPGGLPMALLGAALVVKDQVLGDVNQHGKEKFVDTIANDLHADEFGRFQKVDGRWYDTGRYVAGRNPSDDPIEIRDPVLIRQLDAVSDKISQNNTHNQATGGYQPLQVGQGPILEDANAIRWPDGWSREGSRDDDVIHLRHVDGREILIAPDQVIYSNPNGLNEVHTRNPDGSWNYYSKVTGRSSAEQDASDAASSDPTDPIIQTRHVVLPGDTLSDIADSYGVNVEDLIRLNPKLADHPDLIRPGEVILLREQQASSVFTGERYQVADSGQISSDISPGLVDDDEAQPLDTDTSEEKTGQEHVSGSAFDGSVAFQRVLAGNPGLLDPFGPGHQESEPNLAGQDIPTEQQAIITQHVISSLQASMSLFQSLDSGDPKAIVSSGINLANLIDGYNSDIDLHLDGTANAINLVNRIGTLNAAIDNGDTLEIMQAGLNLGSSTANILTAIGNDTDALSMLQGMGPMAGYLSAAGSMVAMLDDLRDGDIAAGVSDAMAAYATVTQLTNAALASANPYLIAASMAINMVLQMTADEPYHAPTGEARLQRTELYTAPDGGDLSRLSERGEPVGEGMTLVTHGHDGNDLDLFVGQLGDKWDSLQAIVPAKSGGAEIAGQVLLEMVGRLQDGLPDGAGIVPERLPAVGFNGDHFVIRLTDPANGDEMTIPVSPDKVMDTLMEAAHAAQAVVPEWELQTVEAKYAQYRDAVEQYESARRQAEMDMTGEPPTPPQADYWKPDEIQANALDVINHTRQVSIADLANDGIQLLHRGAMFDMDDDGFRERTDWVMPDDALVAIDRNLNDVIDTGSDLFAGNFDWLDVDSDGRFTADDPAFSYMRLWQDQDSDGVSDPGEMRTLAELGVVSIHEQDGQLYGHRADGTVIPILVRDLGFDANGEMRIAMPDGGTLVLHESGEAVWSGGSVRDLSGMLTTGGGNVDGSPVFVVSTLDDMVSESVDNMPPLQRELRRVTRMDMSTMFSGPMAAILALGLGISAVAEAGMVRFELVDVVKQAMPPAPDQDAPLAPIPGDDDQRHPAAGPVAAPHGPVIDPEAYTALERINQAGGIPGSELALHLQAMLASDSFEMPGLSGDQLLAVRDVLEGLGFAVPGRHPNEQDVIVPASADVAANDTATAKEKTSAAESGRGEGVDKANSETLLPGQHINTSPTAGDDLLVAIEDTPNLIPASELLANDTDGDGDALRIREVMNAINGDVDMMADGTVRFIPAPDYFGPAGFDYVIDDGNGGTAMAHASLDVLAVEDIPRLGNASLVGIEDRVGLFTAEQLLANDSDPDGDVLQLLDVANADHGVIERLADGTVRYMPEENYFGEVHFEYTATDGNGNEVSASALLDILPVNDLPVTADEVLPDKDEDTVYLVDPVMLLANDHDIESATLAIDAVGGALNGTVGLRADGLIEFQPDADFNGLAGFEYTVIDEDGGRSTAQARFDILPVNDAPVATNDGIRVVSGGDNVVAGTRLLANDHDVDGDRIQISSVANAANGSVSLADNGDIVFTPAAGYTGPAGFDYRITDGNGTNAQAHVAIDVVPNTPPVVNDESLVINEDETITFTPDSLLTNDYDIDGQSLGIAAVGNAVHGDVQLQQDGSIRFVPVRDFSGEAGFDYIVDDGFGGQASGSVRLTVQPVNDAPVVIGERIGNGSEDATQVILADALLANDHDVEGDAFGLASVQNARHGNVSMNAQGDVVFRPDANFNGTASFDYTVVDVHGAASTGRATVDIAPVNDNPTAGADGLMAREDTRRVIDASELLRNDHDVDGDRLSVTSVGGAFHGRAYLFGNSVVYEPHADYAGADSFHYTVSDGHGGSAIGQVSVSVAAVNDAPYFTVGRYTNQYDRHRTDGIVRANDPDGANNQIRYHISNQPLIGSARVDATTGQWSFWSNHYNNYDGSIKFTITARDGQGATASINVPVHHFGGGPNVNHPYSVQQVYGRTSFLPVVLDLDGDGIELIPLDESGVSFDTNGDGMPSLTGWVAPDDGLLAWDHDDDEVIRHDELSFADYLDGADSDLAGLRAFDSNDDGLLSTADQEWPHFVVWQDGNSNGVSDAGEVMGLDESGITAIDLAATESLPDDMDSQVTALGEYIKEDGTSGQLADVAFEVVADDFLQDEQQPVGEMDMLVGGIPDDTAIEDTQAAIDVGTETEAIDGETDAVVTPEEAHTSDASVVDTNGVDQTIDLLVTDIASFDPPEPTAPAPIQDTVELVPVIDQPDNGEAASIAG